MYTFLLQIYHPDYTAYEVVYAATQSPTLNPTVAPSSATCADVEIKLKYCTGSAVKIVKAGALLKIKIMISNNDKHSVYEHNHAIDNSAVRIFLPNEVKYLKSRSNSVDGQPRDSKTVIQWSLINFKHKNKRVFVVMLQVNRNATTDLALLVDYINYDNHCIEQQLFKVSNTVSERLITNMPMTD